MMHEMTFGYEPYIQPTVFRWRFRRHGGLGNARAAPKTNHHRPFLALAEQSCGRGVGHAANARNARVAGITVLLPELAELAREPIVLVCRIDKRSRAVAQTLRAAGFTQIQILRRGIEQERDWPAGGRSRSGRVTIGDRP